MGFQTMVTHQVEILDTCAVKLYYTCTIINYLCIEYYFVSCYSIIIMTVSQQWCAHPHKATMQTQSQANVFLPILNPTQLAQLPSLYYLQHISSFLVFTHYTLSAPTSFLPFPFPPPPSPFSLVHFLPYVYLQTLGTLLYISHSPPTPPPSTHYPCTLYPP